MVYKVSLVTPADEDAVNEFLQVHFYANEPLNIAIRQRFDSRHPGTSHFSYSVFTLIANGLSVKAEDEEGNLVGVAVNTAPLDGFAVSRVDIKGERHLIEEIIKFLNFIEELTKDHGDIIAKHNSNVMDIKILTVSTTHRQRGIGALLMSESIKIADSKKLAVTVGCSSHFTSRIVEKFPQFKKIVSFPIRQYLDVNGDIVFNVQEPHLNYDVFLYEK